MNNELQYKDNMILKYTELQRTSMLSTTRHTRACTPHTTVQVRVCLAIAAAFKIPQTGQQHEVAAFHQAPGTAKSISNIFLANPAAPLASKREPHTHNLGPVVVA